MNIQSILKKFDIERGEAEVITVPYQIEKINKMQRIVTGQVYAPDCLDSHGHFMTAKQLEKTAHQFMMDGLQNSIDFMHDNELVDACIVESFIARGHPDWEEGSWVASTKISDDDAWEAVLDGRINGYSFEILTYKHKIEVDIEYKSWFYGFTDPSPDDNHSHSYLVKMDDKGNILWGQTSEADDGHIHKIERSNITQKADGHSHRFHLEKD